MEIDNLDLSILKVLISNRKQALDFISEGDEKLFGSDLFRFSKLIIDYIRIYKEIPTKRIIIDKVKTSKNEALLRHTETIFNKLDEFIYDDKEYRHDLEKLKNRFLERMISSLKESLNSSIDLKKNISSIQNILNTVKSINQPKIFKGGTLKDYADDFKNIYAAKLQDPTFGTGIKTGYSFIDYAICGMRPSEFLLFAGITSSGKSLLLMNTAIQMWMGENDIYMTNNYKKGYNVLLFSLEMNYEDYMQRALARIAMVPQKSIRDATLVNEDKDKITKVFKFIKSYPYYFKVIDLPRRATAEMIERIIDEEADKNGKPDVVVIDYLNLMDADIGKDQSDWLIQARIAEDCHELARVKEVAMLSAVQLNPKGGDKTETEGSLGIKSLRRSSQIGDNASFIIGINTRKGEKNYPDFSCSFLKNRRGELVDGKLRKEMACCALLDKKIEEGQDNEDISRMIGS
jgi:replicative DNA helicase